MKSLRRWSIFPITTRLLTVKKVTDLTPGMRRVTLTGEQLAAHTADNGFPVAAFCSDGFDDELKLILRHPDAPEPIGPIQRDGVLDWPDHPHAVYRTYSVRRWNAEAGEVDIDLVIHGNGPGTTWAREVVVGDSVQIAGPKWAGSHPVGATWCLIGGDETALPAIGRWLEEFPEDGRAEVYIEIANDTHRQELTYPPGVRVTWLSRNGAPAGTVPLLAEAIQAGPWHEGTVFAWVAGEARSIAPIRRWLRKDKQLPTEQVEVTGYWRLSDDAAELAGDGAPAGPVVHIHEMTNLITPMAIGVAATVGLGPVLSCGPVGIGRIARETGCEATALTKLLQYLSAIGVVRIHGSGLGRTFEWSRAGQVLGEEAMIDYTRFDSVKGVRDIGIFGLLETVRTGAPAAHSARNALLPHVNDADLLSDQLAQDAEMIGFLSDPLSRAQALVGVSSVCVAGIAAGELARFLLESVPSLTTAAAYMSSAAAELIGAELADSPVQVLAGDITEPPTGFQVILLADVLAAHRDEQAVAILQAAAGAAEKVVVVSRLMDPAALDDHFCGVDLLGYVHGEAGVRTSAELDKVIKAAGLSENSRQTVGWGFDVRELS